MKCIASILRNSRAAWASLLCWSALYGTAFAASVEEKKTDTQPFATAYIVVILIVAVGLLFVVRSSGRRDRARPEQYGEANTDVKDEHS